MKKTLLIGIFVGTFLCAALPANADTLEDILTNVRSNFNALGKVTATVDITFSYYAPFDDEDWDADWVDATYKSDPGNDKIRMEGTGADTRLYLCDGTYNWASKSGSDPFDGDSFSASAEDRMYNFAWLVDNNTWSFGNPNQQTVNGVVCWHLTSTNYNMWVDTATQKKVMRSCDNSSSDAVLFSGYSYLESTAYMYDDATFYPYGGGTQQTELYSIDIDATVSDSEFNSP